jgi:hypothetical protein
VAAEAIEVIEQFADGEATTGRVREFVNSVRSLRQRVFGAAGGDPAAAPPGRLAALYAIEVAGSERPTQHVVPHVTRAAQQHDGRSPADTRAQLFRLYHDITGLPRTAQVPLAPSWRTTTAVQLARQMYESRDFSAMPILADALQDASCDSDDILTHCRDPQAAHVRGCWVVDLILGKS